MLARVECWVFIFFLLNNSTMAQDVITPSDPSVTTDTIKSGDMIIGINSNGGGVINYLFIPGIGNIFGPQSVKYGRSGQSAIRDGLHSGKYNPTQAGFNETLGTKCLVVRQNDRLIVPARPVALWYGDGAWDFTEWENIGADPYSDGGNSDQDQIDECQLAGKQNTEVKSEFDYYGMYADYFQKGGISIPCVRHYFEYRFARPPGHCFSQFGPGLSVFNAEQTHPDISNFAPAGTHKAESYDMSYFLMSWHLRNDVANWDPKFRFIKNTDGTWNTSVKDRSEALVSESYGSDGKITVPRLVVICDTDNPDDETALGFYMPDSEFNRKQTIGVDIQTDSIKYTDNRYTSIRLWDQSRRISTMAVYGFKVESNGILNPTRLSQNTYEALRYDLFILKGSPNKIWETVNNIEKVPLSWQFSNRNEGWNSTEGIVQTIKNNALNLIISKPDQMLLSPDKLLIDASLQKYLVFRIKNNTTDTNLKLAFRKYGSNETFYHSLQTSSMDKDWKFYKVNISKNPEWNGVITQIAFSFSAGSGTVDVEMVAANGDALNDCNGVFGGSAYIDGCSDCVGGNTGKVPCDDCMGVPGGKAYLNNCGMCVGGASETIPAIEWEFNSLSSWSLNPRLTGYSNSSVAYLNISGTDPYMTYINPVCINASVYKYLKIRVKNKTNGVAAALYFQNDVTNSMKAASISLSPSDSELKSYIIDLSNNPDWVGNISKIRFDPPGSGGAFEIDYIKISSNDFNVSVSNLENLENDEMRIIPNPANGKVRVVLDNPFNIAVFTLSGQMIFQSETVNCSHQINIESWIPGIYLVQSWNGVVRLTEKLIVK